MKKLLAGVVVVSLVIGLMGLVVGDVPAYAQQYTLQLAGAYPSAQDTPRVLAAKLFKELLEKKSNGKIKVELYLDSKLGGDRETVESCQAGNIAMVSLTTAPMVGFVPKLAVFDIAMLFDDLDVAKKALDPFKGKLIPDYEKAGFKLLMFTPIYFRELTTKKPVKSIDDLKGLKIRTMENKYHLAFWRALGANPTPLSFAELYVALQQGIVDAQENPYEIIWSAKFYEVQKYVVNTHHICFVFTYIMNKKLYDGMPADYQKTVTDVTNEVSEYLFKESKTQTSAMLVELQKKGMEIIEVTPEMRQRMKEAAKGVADMVRSAVGSEIVDDLLLAITQVKK
ncbi:MAG: TRAP transporter substrate-binding protein [Synergistetes bacterium]|nr:TRAP transporter substrate-binding protein [Synergistota bacterium]MDW8191508.1 TRAP transporter substrate-binding protein [Synergistota bacterium]